MSPPSQVGSSPSYPSSTTDRDPMSLPASLRTLTNTLVTDGQPHRAKDSLAVDIDPQSYVDGFDKVASPKSQSSSMMTPNRPRATSVATNSYLRLIANGNLTSPQAITTTLTNALGATDYPDCVKNLCRPDVGIHPQSFIDGLDKMIEILSPESDIRGRCVRALRKACGMYRLLPDSHEVKSALKNGPRAVAPGGFSDVWKAENENGEVFAVKVFRVYEKGLELVQKRYCKEVVISKRMIHPNVLPIEGVAPGLFECCMVSRWMDHGNLQEYLNRSKGGINRLELLLGIIRGLKYLHTHQVVHGDLKGHNILIDAHGRPCLADFGLSSIAESICSVSGSTTTGGGSTRWLAPELMGTGQMTTTEEARRVRPTPQSDIYSLAMVVVEVFTGQVPFPGFTDQNVVVSVSGGVRPAKPLDGEKLGLEPAVWELTEECWNRDPRKRPDITDVFHRFKVIVVTDPLVSPSSPEEPSGGGPFSPTRGLLKRTVRKSVSNQDRINELDQELERVTVPDEGRTAKLNELCKLCGDHVLIPDSMRLRKYDNEPVEMRKYGDSSPVYQNKFKGRKVAIKVVWLYVPQKLDEPYRRFCREVVTWKHLRHPNILPLLGATMRDNRLCLVSEWMDQGNINDYLKPRERAEVNRIELLVNVAGGLSYMHGLQVVHGNLKGANIYIRNFRACIADFGVSTIARLEPTVNSGAASTASLVSFTSGGSPRWMSPELLDPSRLDDRDPRPTKESDCYALGMVIYEVLCGHEPYDGLNQDTASDNILKGIRPHKPIAAAHLGLVAELWEVLERCWDKNRERRPDAEAIRSRLKGVTPHWHARRDLR